MPTDVILPKVDMVMDAGTIVRWYRQENEAVQAGEPLLEIETDKSSIDVESPASGTLVAVSARPGETIPVATRIALILAPGETAPDPGPQAPAPRPRPPDPAPRPRATPAARAIAREHNIDLAALNGSGPNGRVRRDDVLAAVQEAELPTPAAGIRPPDREPGPPNARPRPPEDGELIPLAGVRRVVAERLTASAAIPTFVLSVDVDMSAANALRERLPYRPSVTAIIARAVAPLLLRHPDLNSSLRPEGLWRHGAAHLGIAMDIDGRLLVPVIRDSQGRGLADIHAELGRLRQAAAGRQLGPAELQGSSFSISNLGMLGVDRFTALINPPEAAILAVGRTVERYVRVGGTPDFRPMLTLTLSVDHRVADGASAARFLGDLRAALEEPYLML
jgi:pyruvate dehydrogenase E2 component (dihydrolipoamide acetyltransferase)